MIEDTKVCVVILPNSTPWYLLHASPGNIQYSKEAARIPVQVSTYENGDAGCQDHFSEKGEMR